MEEPLQIADVSDEEARFIVYRLMTKAESLRCFRNLKEV